MITISIPTGRDFWKAIALFAYRRWAQPGEKKPLGVPGNRDPDNPCAAYEPVEWRTPVWNDCETDGHYLCAECCHRTPMKEFAEEDCPGHIASELDQKICGRCGAHVDSLRQDDDGREQNEFPEARHG